MLEAIPDGVEAIPAGFTRGSLPVDITDQAAVAEMVSECAPDAIVHLAAVSEVAVAGADPSVAFAVNVRGTANVARAASAAGARLIALSSDVVFDGTSAPYDEASTPHPINDYGRSKLAGEEAVAAHHSSPLIIRASVLVGRDRADRYPFSAFILERAATGTPIELYENERRNFYPVTHAAKAVWECTASHLTGVLHIGSATSQSRYEFGTRLIEAAGYDPALAMSTVGPAHRPSDLTLNVERAGRQLTTRLPTAEEAIAEVIADTQGNRDDVGSR